MSMQHLVSLGQTVAELLSETRKAFSPNAVVDVRRHRRHNFKKYIGTY